MGKSYEYDVALSFAGEDRAHADKLAKILRDSGVRVFYDDFVKATLWGKDLYQHLQKIYKDQANYCVVFVSEHYIEKGWTKHELRHAQSRSFENDREYILPLRLDDTLLPGLAPTIGYLDLGKHTLEQVAVLLLEKLGMPDDAVDHDEERVNWAGDFVEYKGMRMASYWPARIERAQQETVYLITRSFPRVRYGEEKSLKRRKKSLGPCHDCAASPGQYHVASCDVEECPACGGQALSCDCAEIALAHDPLPE